MTLPPAPVVDPAAPDPHASEREAFLDALRAAVDEDGFDALVLSKPRRANDAPATIRIRRVALKHGPALSFVSSHPSRDETRILAIDEGLSTVARLLDPRGTPSFCHATLHAAAGDVQLLVSKRGKATLRRHARAAGDDRVAAPQTHDRPRRRRLSSALPFLVELGITDAAHRLVPSMARKWRQIDKFLEVIDAALDALAVDGAAPPAMPIRVVDYGCGKGYLTFAVHEHLRCRFGRAPSVTGVELRPELVEFCNGVAERCGCAGLTFVAGDLRTFVPTEVDIVIALHACDTATDHAIDLGVRAAARVLVCSPCCHKELRPQLARPRLLSGLLRHGVHLGQEAEMVTDSMRALLLETCGYDAQVFEFVALEHTSKNKMILARRRSGATDQAARARAELADLKTFYGIREQRLEALLRAHADAAAAAPSQACQTP